MDAKERYDLKQARRKQNRELRKQGLEVLIGSASDLRQSKRTTGPQIGTLQKRAETDMRLRLSLNKEIDAKDKGSAQAAKLKRNLNNTWINRGTQSVRGFWNKANAK